jgi:hypothetical protein
LVIFSSKGDLVEEYFKGDGINQGITIQNLKAGIYFVRATTVDKKVYHTRFIKE